MRPMDPRRREAVYTSASMSRIPGTMTQRSTQPATAPPPQRSLQIGTRTSAIRASARRTSTLIPVKGPTSARKLSLHPRLAKAWPAGIDWLQQKRVF